MSCGSLDPLDGGDDGIRFSRELRARSSTVANVHRKFALYRFPFESASMVTDFLQYLLLGGDDGIRFSRELRARSSTVANVHRKFALYRFPFESASWVTDFLQYLLLGGDDGIRTHDPLLAGQVLSQLSYTPKLN